MRKDEFPIVDKLVKDSINEVLDKIRAEIKKIQNKPFCTDGERQGLDVALAIIDEQR